MIGFSFIIPEIALKIHGVATPNENSVTELRFSLRLNCLLILNRELHMKLDAIVWIPVKR